jgi:hypothetical protein
MFGIMDSRDAYPEVDELGQFFECFNKETDRGAALVAASMLDARLQEILGAFFIESPTARDLLVGFSAPIGTFGARAAAAFALGLIQENEFREITIIRKIRNEFGHAWQPLSFASGRIGELVNQLPWLGPGKLEVNSSPRGRFNIAVAGLLRDLLWRVRLVVEERRTKRIWPNRGRPD